MNKWAEEMLEMLQLQENYLQMEILERRNRLKYLQHKRELLLLEMEKEELGEIKFPKT